MLSAAASSYQDSTHKIHTDRRNITLRICVVGESKKQARFSHSRVSDKEELEKVIVSKCYVSKASTWEQESQNRIPKGLSGETLENNSVGVTQSARYLDMEYVVWVGS
jgi:hypothetical protein